METPNDNYLLRSNRDDYKINIISNYKKIYVHKCD